MTFRVDLLTNILVTGGAGFIGHHLVKRLSQEDNFKITVIDNLSNSNNNFEINNLHKKIMFYKEDIRNKETLNYIIKREKIDTCVHLAARISVLDSIVNPFDTVDVNVRGTLSALDACANNDVQNFVFASSAAVYGEAKSLPARESQTLAPLSPYAATKISSEALVSSYGNSGRIKRTASLRFFNVYGEGQSPEYAGVITKFVERLSKGLPPVIFGNGEQTRDFIHVDDVVDAISLAINKQVSGILNIGTGKPISVNKLAKIMITAFKLNLRPTYLKARNGDIRQSYASTKQSRTRLGFKADRNLANYVDNIAKMQMTPDNYQTNNVIPK